MKKYICLILSLALLAGIFVCNQSLTAYADDASPAPDMQNAKWLNYLGVSTKLSGEYVTRGEFLCAVIRLLNLEKSSAAMAHFNDVDASTELGGAVETALGLKLIGAAESFEPNRPITYYEACKIAVIALGYGYDAVKLGGYPTGYAIAASKLNLPAQSETNQLDCEEYAEFLASMTHCVVRREASVIEDENGFLTDYEGGVLFAEKYHDLKKIEGIVEANEITSIYTANKPSDEGYVVINETAYKADMTLCPLGYSAYGYAESDGTIAHLWTDDNNVVRVTDSQLHECDDSGITYYDSDAEKKIKLASDVVYIKNGQAVRGKLADFIPKDGYMEFISNDGDKTADVVSIFESSFISVSRASVSNETITDKNTGKTLHLSEKMFSFNEGGIGNLSSGAVVEYYVSPDGKYYDFKICKNTISGKISGISTDSSVIYIDDTPYETTSYFKNYCQKLVVPGTDVKAYVSDCGKLIYMDTSDESPFKYGYVFDCGESKNSLEREKLIRVCTESGELKVFALDDYVVLNDVRKPAADVFALLSNGEEMLVRYREKDGIITKINTDNGTGEQYDKNVSGRDVLQRYHFKDYDTSLKIPYNSSGYFVPFFFVNNNTVIFAVKPETRESDPEKRFSVGGGADFLSGINDPERQSIQAFNVDKDGYAEAVVYVDDGSRNSYIDNWVPQAIVAGVTTELDEDGDAIWRLTLYWQDNYFKLYVDPEADFVNAETFTQGYGENEPPFTPGDYLRYNKSGDELVYAVKDYDNKLCVNNFSVGSHDQSLNFYSGKLKNCSETSFSLVVTGGHTDLGSECYFLLPQTIITVSANGLVQTRPSSELSDYLENPKFREVFLYCQYSTTKSVVVYEN